MTVSAPTSAPFVIVGMSGGVDSSVAAALLLQQGYRVEGLFMKNWEEDDGTEYCTAKKDLDDAQSVCDKLGIKLHTANFAMEYWDRVFEHFLTEYRAGRTPNPDILCNKEIKFKAFLDYALTLGADYIATGHYARRGQTANIDNQTIATLCRGKDANKDQSYFLHAVAGNKLAKTLFPVGELEKPEVRAIATQLGLITSTKKDSTGICFIGERKFRDFLQQYIPAKPGVMIDDQGKYLGEHQGLMYYTIGQRGGIGLGGQRDTEEGAWYVLAKDVANNRLIVGQGHHHAMLNSTELTSAAVDWVAGVSPFELNHVSALRCAAKTRYRQPDQQCTVYPLAQGKVRVVFDDAQRAVTPGQSVVFYQDDVCLGGGVIEWSNAPVPEQLLDAQFNFLSPLSKTKQHKLLKQYPYLRA